MSTSRTGGAGIAAYRLHVGLKSRGVESYFLTLFKKNIEASQFEIEINRTFFSRAVSTILARLNLRLSQTTYFTILSSSPLKSKELTKFGQPSEVIFHIHNWFNLINLVEIEKLLESGYQIIFTLHDQRLFTGGCHYSMNCKKFMTDCRECPLLPSVTKYYPTKNLIQAKRIFSKFSNQIEIVAPSNWILQLAQMSEVCANNSLRVIPNWHDSNSRNQLQTHARVRNGTSRVTLGIASMDKASILKGSNIIKEFQKLILANKKNVDVIYLSDLIKEGNQTDYFWNSIDYLLVPSVLDNSPNVIFEAKIHGVPVIATNVGGISELLNSKYDYSIELSTETPNLILRLLDDLVAPVPTKTKDEIRLDLEFNYKMVLDKYINFYSKII